MAVLVAVLVGAQPRVSSGRVEVAAVGSNLAAQVRGFAGPSWVGYAVEAVAAHRGYCTSENGVADGTAFLEGERAAHILLRVDKGQVERVRVLSPSCTLDVDALTLHWLTGVRAVESVAFLKSLQGGVGAIAAHADPSADAFLKETAESATASRADRQRAAYALASTRGANGFAIVRRLADTDSDEKFRESLTGALAQAPGGTGASALMDLAMRDKNRKVRERAFFWLGRSKDP